MPKGHLPRVRLGSIYLTFYVTTNKIARPLTPPEKQYYYPATHSYLPSHTKWHRKEVEMENFIIQQNHREDSDIGNKRLSWERKGRKGVGEKSQY